MGRMGIKIGLAVVLIVAIAWVYRAEIAIQAIGWYVESNRDIGPNREVPWQRGRETATQAPSERPPNIVLILAEVEELSALLAAHLAEQVPPRWPHRGSNPVSIDKHLNQPESPDDEFIYYPN